MRETTTQNGAFALTPALAAKIGSIVVHVEEAIGPDGHPFDVEAIRPLLADAEVQAWLANLRTLALIPERRERDDE